MTTGFEAEPSNRTTSTGNSEAGHRRGPESVPAADLAQGLRVGTRKNEIGRRDHAGSLLDWSVPSTDEPGNRFRRSTPAPACRTVWSALPSMRERRAKRGRVETIREDMAMKSLAWKVVITALYGLAAGSIAGRRGRRRRRKSRGAGREQGGVPARRARRRGVVLGLSGRSRGARPARRRARPSRRRIAQRLSGLLARLRPLAAGDERLQRETGARPISTPISSRRSSAFSRRWPAIPTGTR